MLNVATTAHTALLYAWYGPSAEGAEGRCKSRPHLVIYVLFKPETRGKPGRKQRTRYVAYDSTSGKGRVVLKSTAAKLVVPVAYSVNTLARPSKAACRPATINELKPSTPIVGKGPFACSVQGCGP